MHESDDIEGHLLGRESANSGRPNFLSNHIGLAHETCAASPAKRRFRIANSASDNETYSIMVPTRRAREGGVQWSVEEQERHQLMWRAKWVARGDVFEDFLWDGTERDGILVL